MNDPQLLLADEPTGNLDEENSEIVLGYFSEFTAKGGAVLLVTHDRDAAGYAQKTMRLEDGALREE